MLLLKIFSFCHYLESRYKTDGSFQYFNNYISTIIIIFYPLIIDYQEKTKKFLTDKIDRYIYFKNYTLYEYLKIK